MKFLNSAFGLLASAFVRAFLKNEWSILKATLQRAYQQDANRPVFYPPPLMQQLLISGEDHRFFLHAGVDLLAVARAIWRGTVLGKVEGASTIEMQLVRVLTGRYERTLSRKLVEMMLACMLPSVIPRTHLPSMYLIRGYYGWRMNGFLQACDRLELTPRNMTKKHCAEVVARLKYPEPQFPSETRVGQIQRRASYLLSLWKRHMVDGTYGSLTNGDSA